MFLSAYMYTIEYKCGKSHANANCLSRIPVQKFRDMKDPLTVFQVFFIEELLVKAVDIAMETKKDNTLAVHNGG